MPNRIWRCGVMVGLPLVPRRGQDAQCPILAAWDIREMQRSRRSRLQASPQVVQQRPTLAVAVCKTVPCDWRMHKIQKAAGQSTRRLTDLLTRPPGTGETTQDSRHPRYQGRRPFLEQRKGLLRVVCARIPGRPYLSCRPSCFRPRGDERADGCASIFVAAASA